MRIIADENISDLLVARLRSQGHQVTYIKETAQGSLDPMVLALATQEDALLITNDKDFGELVYHQQQAYSGVLLVRLGHLTVEEEAEEVARLIQAHGEGLLSAFTVIKQRGKARIRKRTP
jgi:predicted nuclease of predicted toxin-antitoxin system